MALDCTTIDAAITNTRVRARMRRQPTTAPLMMSGRKNIAATRAASLASWAAPACGVTMSPSSWPPKIS
jgi:hypothetical protein